MGNRHEEIGPMILEAEWGIQKTPYGPFLNIIPIYPHYLKELVVFRRQFFIWITFPRWILHPRRKTIRYLVLDWSVVLLLLRIAANPTYNIFVFRSFLRCEESVTRGGNFYFVVRLLRYRMRKLWNFFIGAYTHRVPSWYKFSFLYSLEWILLFSFHLPVTEKSCTECITVNGRGRVSLII